MQKVISKLKQMLTYICRFIVQDQLLYVNRNMCFSHPSLTINPDKSWDFNFHVYRI